MVTFSQARQLQPQLSRSLDYCTGLELLVDLDASYILSHQSERLSAYLSTSFLSLSLTVVYFRWLKTQPEARRMSPALLLMKMNFLLDIPLAFVRMCPTRSTCAATAITFWRKPCKRSVGIGTAQPASPGLYGRSLPQGHTSVAASVARITPESCVMPLCSVDESVATRPAGPQLFSCLEVPVVGCRLLSASLFPPWKSMRWGRLDCWA